MLTVRNGSVEMLKLPNILVDHQSKPEFLNTTNETWIDIKIIHRDYSDSEDFRSSVFGTFKYLSKYTDNLVDTTSPILGSFSDYASPAFQWSVGDYISNNFRKETFRSFDFWRNNKELDILIEFHEALNQTDTQIRIKSRYNISFDLIEETPTPMTFAPEDAKNGGFETELI